MSGILLIKRARGVPVGVKILREITNTLLGELLALENFELGIHLVRDAEMARVNEAFLNHEGATDVITFDHSFGVPPSGGAPTPGRLKAELQTLHGELFVCYDVACSQAREFRTSWQSEIVRYIVHGVLHLQGFDDHCAEDRRKMKREENRLLRELGKRFRLCAIADADLNKTILNETDENHSN